MELERPFWYLELIHNEGDQIRLYLDKSAEDKRKSVKESWWKNDPDRIKKAAVARLMAALFTLNLTYLLI